jgi:hypothetical protein
VIFIISVDSHIIALKIGDIKRENSYSLKDTDSFK